MKSKMLATTMIAPAVTKCPRPSAHAGGDVDEDADERENIRVDPQPRRRRR